MMGQICKHRMRILEGNVEGIVSCKEEDVKHVASWFAGSNIASALLGLRAAEARLAIAQKELSMNKKRLAKVLEG